MAKDRDTEPTEESAPSADDATQAGTPDLDETVDGAQAADADAADEEPDEGDADRAEDSQELALVGADKPGKDAGGKRARRAKDATGDASTTSRRRSRKRDADDGDDEASQPRGKGHATPKQRRVEAAPERTTPVRFVAEAIAELRKVVWPTSTQLRTYFVVVLVFVLFVIAFVSLLDLGFGWVILKVLG